MIKAVSADHLSESAGQNGIHAPKNDKDVSDSHGQQQAINPCRVFKATFVNLEASAFDVREKSFNFETLAIPQFSLFFSRHIGYEKPMSFFRATPDDQDVDWPNRVTFSELQIGQKSFLTRGEG